MIAICIAGALAGVGGAFEVCGVTGRLYSGLSPGHGYTAIAVALLARLHPLSVVRQTFSVGDEQAGTIAIIGPTRMNYEHGIKLLDYTAVAISQTLTKLLR